MQRVATELHSALEARDDVWMRTVALRSSWKWLHIKVVPFLVWVAARLGRDAAAHRADAILFTSMTTALPLLIAGPALKKKGIQLAAIVHGLDVTDPNPMYQMAVRHLCGMLDAVMPVSRATGEELVARGLPRERVHVVPNAVDLDRFEGVAASRSEPTRVHIAGALPLPDDAFLLVTVGRQVRRKGFVWFIENVMPKLPERVIFWLAGDGPERENIEAAIERAGLQQRVRCLGKISEEELVELYRRGKLFVMPNIVVPGDMEGFGIVMLEAGACGTMASTAGSPPPRTPKRLQRGLSRYWTIPTASARQASALRSTSPRRFGGTAPPNATSTRCAASNTDAPMSRRVASSTGLR
jgi:phosphatidylinositol alpha-1,6-mannosyltransferase